MKSKDSPVTWLDQEESRIAKCDVFPMEDKHCLTGRLKECWGCKKHSKYAVSSLIFDPSETFVLSKNANLIIFTKGRKLYSLKLTCPLRLKFVYPG